jgi:hypothetical protein
VKVFLDANILFSAAAPESNVAKLINLVQEHGQCVTSLYAVEEARKNLKLKQFDSLEIFELLLTTVTVSNKLVLDLSVTIKSKDKYLNKINYTLNFPVSRFPFPSLNQKINFAQVLIPILGSAIAQQCTYLLTGDKRDFGLFCV